MAAKANTIEVQYWIPDVLGGRGGSKWKMSKKKATIVEAQELVKGLRDDHARFRNENIDNHPRQVLFRAVRWVSESAYYDIEYPDCVVNVD